MMYLEVVKNTMKNQKEERKELKITQSKARETVAIDILEDAKCAVKELKCEYLLDTPVEVANEITINKGKIVKVEVEKIITRDVKVSDPEVLKQLETARKTISTWQSKYDNLTKALTEKDNYIAKLMKEIESLKAPKEEPVQELDYFSTPEYQEYLEMEAARIESNECVVTIEETIKPVVKTVKEETIEIKEIDVKLQQYSNASIFKYNNGYFIASPKAQEITWLPNGNEALSQATKDSIVKNLIDNYKFPTTRVSVSPYIVTRPNAYFARVAALDGVETFSPSDIFSGYVFYQGQYFLFTYEPGKFAGKVFVDEFSKKISKQIARPSKAKLQVITKEVLDMYEEYKTLINKEVVKETKVQEPVVETKKVTEDINNVSSKVSRIAQQRRAQKAAKMHNKVNAHQQLMSMYKFDEEEIKGDGVETNRLSDSAQDRLAMMLGK